MADYVLTDSAQADVEDIIAAIAKDGVKTATRFVEEVYDAFEFLAKHPRAGHRRTDLTDRKVLFWTVMRAFTIVYRISDPLVIVRVVRWRRATRMFFAEGGIEER